MEKNIYYKLWWYYRVCFKIGEVQRDSIDPKKNYADVLRKKGAIIHINGYIGNVTEDDLDDTFKLLIDLIKGEQYQIVILHLHYLMI